LVLDDKIVAKCLSPVFPDKYFEIENIRYKFVRQAEVQINIEPWLGWTRADRPVSS
jgi:hypothetical protein